jgi:hypothetical protein
MFSPCGSVHGGIVPAAEGSDPDPAGCGAVPDDGVSGCPVGIMPVAKLILRRSSLRDSVLAAG